MQRNLEGSHSKCFVDFIKIFFFLLFFSFLINVIHFIFYNCFILVITTETLIFYSNAENVYFVGERGRKPHNKQFTNRLKAEESITLNYITTQSGWKQKYTNQLVQLQ